MEAGSLLGTEHLATVPAKVASGGERGGGVGDEEKRMDSTLRG